MTEFLALHRMQLQDGQLKGQSWEDTTLARLRPRYKCPLVIILVEADSHSGHDVKSFNKECTNNGRAHKH